MVKRAIDHTVERLERELHERLAGDRQFAGEPCVTVRVSEVRRLLNAFKHADSDVASLQSKVKEALPLAERLATIVANLEARVKAAEELCDLGAHTAACQAGFGYGGCETRCSRLRAFIAAGKIGGNGGG